MKRAGRNAIGMLLFFLAAASLAFAEEPCADLKALAKGNNAFALDLYSTLQEEKGNLFFSPYSISTALAMTYGGARAETAGQMAEVLHFELDPEDLGNAFSRLEDHLDSIQEQHPVQLNVANSLWPRKDYPFLPDYIEMIQQQYGTPVTPLDYVGATEDARHTINDWVEKKTRDKIKALISRGDLDDLTVLVLVNAIYFKADWMTPFDKDRTQTAPFHVSGTKQVEASMMYTKGSYRYGRFENFQLIELPYEGEALSMVIVLPNEVDGLSEVEKTLSSERLEEWTSRLRRQDVQVALPRFTITWGTFDLVPHLKRLGMHDPFVLGKADFSGMTTAEAISISLVLHKAFIEVNEEGTEAAAATAVGMQKTAIPRVHRFEADHPFLFFIRDHSTGSILFLGRMCEPGKEGG